LKIQKYGISKGNLYLDLPSNPPAMLIQLQLKPNTLASFCSILLSLANDLFKKVLNRNLKSTILIGLLVLTGLISNSQSYLGTISKQVNLREGPGKEYQVIRSLKPQKQILIFS